MCLHSKQRFRTRKEAKDFTKNPPRADKDIIVYKQLLDNNNSPYKSFKYEKGYHYNESRLRYKERNVLDVWYIEVNQGLHAHVKCPETFYPFKTVKMVIPKGSIFILGNRGDVVTDNLIWY